MIDERCSLSDRVSMGMDSAVSGTYESLGWGLKEERGVGMDNC